MEVLKSLSYLYVMADDEEEPVPQWFGETSKHRRYPWEFDLSKFKPEDENKEIPSFTTLPPQKRNVNAFLYFVKTSEEE